MFKLDLSWDIQEGEDSLSRKSLALLVTKIDPLKKPVSIPGLKYEIKNGKMCTLWGGNLFKGLTTFRYLLVGTNINSTTTGINNNDAFAALIRT